MFTLSKGYYNVTIYNKNNKPLYSGIPLLSALHECMSINIIKYQVENGAYSVTLDCDEAPIDYELANEVLDEALFD